MSEIAVFFGKRIRELRNGQKLSQEELAYRASISPAHLGQIERALKNPTLDTINQLANALNVQVSELFQTHTTSSLIHSDQNVTIEKIDILLEQMAPPQQRDILKIVRIFSEFADKK